MAKSYDLYMEDCPLWLTVERSLIAAINRKVGRKCQFFLFEKTLTSYNFLMHVFASVILYPSFNIISKKLAMIVFFVNNIVKR